MGVRKSGKFARKRDVYGIALMQVPKRKLDQFSDIESMTRCNMVCTYAVYGKEESRSLIDLAIALSPEWHDVRKKCVKAGYMLLSVPGKVDWTKELRVKAMLRCVEPPCEQNLYELDIDEEFRAEGYRILTCELPKSAASADELVFELDVNGRKNKFSWRKKGRVAGEDSIQRQPSFQHNTHHITGSGDADGKPEKSSEDSGISDDESEIGVGFWLASRSCTNPDYGSRSSSLYNGSQSQNLGDGWQHLQPSRQMLFQQLNDSNIHVLNSSSNVRDGDNIIVKRDILVKHDKVVVLYSGDSTDHVGLVQKLINGGFKRVNSPESQTIKILDGHKYNCVLTSDESSVFVHPKRGHKLDVKGLLEKMVERHDYLVSQQHDDKSERILLLKTLAQTVDEIIHPFPFVIKTTRKESENKKTCRNGEQCPCNELASRKRGTSGGGILAGDDTSQVKRMRLSQDPDCSEDTHAVHQEANSNNMQDVLQILSRLQLQEYHNLFKQEAITLDVLIDMGHAELKEIGVMPYGHRAKVMKAVERLLSPVL